jgi:hypothetical protein
MTRRERKELSWKILPLTKPSSHAFRHPAGFLPPILQLSIEELDEIFGASAINDRNMTKGTSIRWNIAILGILKAARPLGS